IVSTSDMFAFTAIEELIRRKVNVPQDIAIVGFNNKYESISSKPTITTIDINQEGMGKLSMEIMISIMRGEKKSGIYHTPTQLKVRQSCGCMCRKDDSTINLHKNNSNCIYGSKHNFNKIWLKQKEKLLLALNKKYSREIGIDKKWNTDLLNGIFDSYTHKSYDDFIIILENIFSHFEENEIHLSKLQDYLLTIKEMFFKTTKDYDFYSWVKTLFDYSNAFLLQQVEKNIATNKIKMVNFETKAILLYQSIVTTYELPQLLELLISKLPDFDIESCYFSLFKEPGKSIEHAILKMAHNSKNTHRLFDNTSYYKSNFLIPPEYYSSLDDLLYIILPLYFKDKPLGFIILGMSALSYFNGIIYEVIRGLISSSLQRASDLHDLEKTQLQLEKKAKEANDANMAKSQFLRNISHEIRTPLTGILGFTDAIKNEADISKIKQYATTIENESNKLIELINQLLDFSKIDSGKLEIQNTRFNLHDTLKMINDAYRQHSVIKKLHYTSNISNDVPTYVQGDSLRLRQILVNLIGNAMKFTNTGSVSINVSIDKETVKELFLHFKISDSGIGIPKEKLTTIFDPFVQVENSNTRKFGGSGLGTAISKQLVTIMGGKIGVESTLNKGSTFWFTIKCNKCTQEKDSSTTQEIEDLSAEQKRILEQSSILIADDYPTNRQVVKFHLEKLKCSIDFAENGRIAVNMFKQHKYDLILMDIQMPELDGLLATSEIRELPGGDKIPVIAMTAIAYEDDIQSFKEKNIDDIITKPFNKNKIREIITYWLLNKKR
ncbi:MAG: ATP-binding protein, partial [Chitinispirillia bacterium]